MGGSGSRRERVDLFETGILSVSKTASQVAKGSQSWQAVRQYYSSFILYTLLVFTVFTRN
jgi:hypothetical protein